MIAEACAKEQVKRLTGLNYFPSEDAAVKELYIVLRGARSEASARNAIDAVVAEMTVCPKPAELRHILQGMSAEREWSAAPDTGAKCQQCNGTGWVHEVRLIKGQRNDYAGRCLCGGAV